MGADENMLFPTNEMPSDDKEKITDIGTKLDGLAKVLNLDPYDENGIFQGKLAAVSHESIHAAQVICLTAVVCETMDCLPRSLRQKTKSRDISRVTLIKGSTIHENIQLLSGYCPRCKTLYVADRERIIGPDTVAMRAYVNDAKYLKAGQNLWVDRVFSKAILNATYSFHASAAAYTEFWNNSFWSTHTGNMRKISRRQVWKIFVEESIRTVATRSGVTLELRDGISIDEVTKQAFSELGKRGVIRASDNHACNECTQKYKSSADVIVSSNPAAVLGMDERRSMPGLNADTPLANNNNMDIDHAPVKMVVVDGIVMGPNVCLLFYFIATNVYYKASTVPTMIAQMILKIIVVEYSVNSIRSRLEPSAI